MRRILRWLLRALLLLAGLVVGYVVVCIAYVHFHESREAAQAAPPGGQFAQGAGASVYSQEFNPGGARGTLLLVHGTGAWSGTWFSLIPALSKAGYRIIAIDLPPFGYSDKSTASDFSRAAQAERILAVLDARHIDRVTVIGHSFGGGPSLEFSLRHPERLDRLVLVDAALGLGAAPPDADAPACRVLNERRLREVLLAATASNPMWAGALLRNFVARKEAVTPERLVEYLRPQDVHGYSAALGAWAYNFGCRAETGWSMDEARIRTLGVPVALLWGEQDTVTPIAQARHLQTLLPGASLHALPGLGHIPHIEDAAAFEAALLDALARTPAQASPEQAAPATQ